MTRTHLLQLSALVSLTFSFCLSIDCPLTLCMCSMQDGMLEIDCADKGINEWPDLSGLVDLALPIRNLRLGGNKLDAVPILAFKGLRVRNLDLADSGLKALSPTAFRGLMGVEGSLSLDLSTNQLTGVPDGVFELLNTTTSLAIDLQGNPLTVGSKTFRGLEPSLQELQLDGVKAQDAVAALANMRNLRTLSMVSSGLTSVAELQGPKSLETLHISYNQLEEGPPLKYLESLETLDISDNKLRSPMFLKQPCEYPKLMFVLASNNPLVCNCELLKATMYKTVTLTAKCAAPDKFAGKRLNDPLSPADTFEAAATGECGVPEYVPRSKWDCECSKFRPAATFDQERGNCPKESHATAERAWTTLIISSVVACYTVALYFS